MRWALLRAPRPGGRLQAEIGKNGKVREPQARLGLVDAERSALSAVLAWSVLFLSFGYDYGLHGYSMQVLNAVLGMVVSFRDQTQYIVAASGSYVRG